MPVIAIASPKGGCGKTTTAMVLVMRLAEMGFSVCVFDCDRNRPIAKRWIEYDKDDKNKERPKSLLPPIEFRETVDEEKIIDMLDEARTKYQFVICDMEGAGTLLMSRAIGRAQFVVIPLKPSDLDADEASKAARLVRAEERNFGRKIGYRILWTETPAGVKSTIEGEIMEEIRTSNIPLFERQLHKREPYRAIFRQRKSLSSLKRTKSNAESIDKAIENAQAVVEELLGHLVAEKEKAA